MNTKTIMLVFITIVIIEIVAIVILGIPKPCPKGTYQKGGKTKWFSNTCNNCPEGEYATGIGNESCTLCSNGTYSDEGADVCEDKCSNVFSVTPKTKDDIMGDEWRTKCNGVDGDVDCSTVRADTMSKQCFNQLWKDSGCPNKSGQGYESNNYYITTPQYLGCTSQESPCDTRTLDDATRVKCTTLNVVENTDALSTNWSDSCVVDNITKYGTGNIDTSLRSLRNRINPELDSYCKN